ncbi:50S ribosomal protein L25/general stress protein Ctc [Populibacterium corticicola]|jgi:large subunit ribosomal protein L25|uniref:Large ribosomal subunit protein bL25 n=1 Tax=Populibacterium corticicola TaxID=1812826 RepID=A0ABW5XCH6_9MICO
MADIKLEASIRDNFGKGAARQARRAGKIPAVVYAHGSEAKHILLDGHEAFLAVKNNRSALVELDIAGKRQNVIIKDIQRDPIGRVIEHIDFLAVKANEKQVVEVPVVTVDDPAAGVMVQLELHKIQVEAVVSDLPEHVEVSVDGLEAGTILHVKDLKLPKGQTAVNDEEQVVLVANEIRATEPEENESTAGEEASAE